MEKNKLAIESLSMDLYRVALGYHNGSVEMAKRFSEEALKRSSEIDKSEVEPYFAKILRKLTAMLKNIELNRVADDALMYSILCKNYAKKFLS